MLTTMVVVRVCVMFSVKVTSRGTDSLTIGHRHELGAAPHILNDVVSGTRGYPRGLDTRGWHSETVQTGSVAGDCGGVGFVVEKQYGERPRGGEVVAGGLARLAPHQRLTQHLLGGVRFCVRVCARGFGSRQGPGDIA